MARQLNEHVICRDWQNSILAPLRPRQRIRDNRQLTAMLRGGLNSNLGDENRKIRNDHPHHAIDAITIGAIDRRMLQELSWRAGQAEEEQRERITADVHILFSNFRDLVRDKVRAVVVQRSPSTAKAVRCTKHSLRPH